MGQVNLLPPDILQGQRYRRLTLTVLLAGAIILALIVVFFLVQVGRLGSVNSNIEAKKQSNAQLQSQIDSLQKYDDLQVQAQQAQSELDAAYAGEVSFSGMLMDLSRVIPSSGRDDRRHNDHHTVDRHDDHRRAGDRVRLVEYLADEARAGPGLGEPLDADDHSEPNGPERLHVHDQR